MRIGVLCASAGELAPCPAMPGQWEPAKNTTLACYSGKLEGVPATALFSGAGKVNAALAAQRMISAYRRGAVISAGTAGGSGEGSAIFDTVVSARLVWATWREAGRRDGLC